MKKEGRQSIITAKNLQDSEKGPPRKDEADRMCGFDPLKFVNEK